MRTSLRIGILSLLSSFAFVWGVIHFGQIGTHKIPLGADSQIVRYDSGKIDYDATLKHAIKDPRVMWYALHPIPAELMRPNSYAQSAAPIAPGPFFVAWANVSTATNTNTLRGLDMLTLTTGTPTVNTTYTTDTATNMCALWPSVASGNSSGYSWDWFLKNVAGSSLTITLAGGTGVTVTGTATIAQNAVKHFKIVVTGCSGTPAATIYSLGSSTF